MKKYFFAVLSLLIVAVLFIAGCTNPALPKSVGEKLEYNLNALQNVIRSLDTLDNNYLINPDISPGSPSNDGVLSVLPTTKKINSLTATVFASGNYNLNVINEDLDANDDDLDSVENFNLENVNIFNNNETKQTNINFDDKAEKENYNTLNNGDNNSLLNNEDVGFEEAEKERMFDENVNTDNNNLVNNELNSANENADLRHNHQPAGENESIEPIKHVSEKEFYDARFIADNVNVKNPAMDSYIEKIQKLYAMTNDSVEANNEFESKKNSINVMIDDLREIAIDLKKGQFEPTRQQIIAINNYISDIRTTISRLRGVNGQLNNEVNKINNVERNGMTTSVDVLNSNYIRILNHIDVRITYLKNAISTLEEIKDLLFEAQHQDYKEEEFLGYNNVNEIDNDINNNTMLNNNEKLSSRNSFNEINAEKENYNNIERRNRFNKQNNLNEDRNNFNNENRRNNNQRTFFRNFNDLDNIVNIDTYSRANTNNSNREIERFRTRRNIDSFNRKRLNNNGAYDNNNMSENLNDNFNNQTNELENVENDNLNNTNNVVENNDVVNTDNQNTNNNAVNNNDVNNNTDVNQNNNLGFNNGYNNNYGFNNGTNFRNDGYYRGVYQNDRITQNNINPGLNNRNNRSFNNNPRFNNNSGFNNNSNFNNPGFNNTNNANYDNSNNIGGVAGDGVINNRSNAHSTVADEHGNVYREGKLIKNTDTYKQSTLIDIINQGTVNNGINTLTLQDENAAVSTDLLLENESVNGATITDEIKQDETLEENAENVSSMNAVKPDEIAETEENTEIDENENTSSVMINDETESASNSNLVETDTENTEEVNADEIEEDTETATEVTEAIENTETDETAETTETTIVTEAVFENYTANLQGFELDQNKLINNLFTSNTNFTFV